MQVIDSVIRVTVVLKLNKRVPDNTNENQKYFDNTCYLLALYQDVSNPSIFPEESLNVFFASSWRNTSQIYPC